MTSPVPAEPVAPAEALRRAIQMATQLRDAMIGQHAAAGHALAVHTQGEDCSWCVRAADECDGSYACEDWKAWQAQYEAAMCIPFAAVLGRWADELDTARSTDDRIVAASDAAVVDLQTQAQRLEALQAQRRIDGAGEPAPEINKPGSSWDRVGIREAVGFLRRGGAPGLADQVAAVLDDFDDVAFRAHLLDAARSTDPGPAPTTYALPAEPPPGERLCTEDGAVWLRDGGDPVRRWRREINYRGEPVDAQNATRLTFAALLEAYGPLSSVTPGTEADQ